ncbi:TRAP transporter substrate-binding protein [Marinobacter salexigens]|uniref:TRAP transporter substrate-binding protein n=1 Tax=Marinobacter salexigens TaxID=1925763 RepID=A0ABS6A7M2_9GAMM|nr:TRAP transporter substrate-binding protein [Marinobacter salexigens]MBU2874173.1 TRAP transporter substrate-binding protein [Marinobacter salexigens]
MFKFKTKMAIKNFTLIGALVAISSNVFASDYKWTFSQPWTRPITDKVIEDFIDKVDEYSNGAIDIKLYKNGLLGSHEETFHGVQDGSITIGIFSPYAKIIPGGVLNWMPWAISNWEAAEEAYRVGGPLHGVLETAYNEVGMHTLMHVSQGAYGIGNTVRPIRKSEDFKNLKIRVSGSLGLVRALEGMGAGTGMTLQTLPWSEIYNGLSRGVIDGNWTMWPSLVDERHAEVLDYYSDINFVWDNQNVAINSDVWNELPENLKSAVKRAAAESQEYSHKLHKEAESNYIQELEELDGFTIVRLTSEERDALREASNIDAIWEELADTWLEKAYPNQNMSEKLRSQLKELNNSSRNSD